MFRTVISRLSPLTQGALRVWGRTPLRIQGRITVGLPLVAVLLSAALAVVGSHQRVNIETDIQRKFEYSATLGAVTTLMVNAETGMRGYLLTGRPDFLEPFEKASEQLPATMTRLTQLATAEPGAKPREAKLGQIQRLQTLTGQQLADLAQQREYVTSGRLLVTNPEILQHLLYGKSLMDEIRAQVDTMQDEERGLLNDRIADVNGIRVRDYASVALALIAALATRFLAWYLFRTGILRRVERLRDNVRNLRRGQALPFPPTDKLDPLGDLEREIHLYAGAERQHAGPDPGPAQR